MSVDVDPEKLRVVEIETLPPPPPDLHVVTDNESELTLADQYSHVPDYLRPREYGHHVIEPIRLGALNMLSQQRGIKNPEQAKIGDSIDRNGLLNLIDVARMPREAMEEYIEFVNEIWGASHSIEDMIPNPDGSYDLVIAGHTRTEEIIRLEMERSAEAEKQGFETNWQDAIVLAKIKTAPTPEKMLAIQADENLHNKPSEERTAMGVVEMYLFGVKKGQWSGKAEFLEKMGNAYSADALNDAIAFQNLPKEVRAYVSIRAIKYGPAVALARAIGPYQRYTLLKYFDTKDRDDLTEEQRAEFDQHMKRWIAIEAGKLQVGKTNVTAARLHFKNLMDDLKKPEGFHDVDDTEDQNQGSLLDEVSDKPKQPKFEEVTLEAASADYKLADPDTEWKKERRRARDELKRVRVEVGKLPLQAANSLRLQAELLGDDTEVIAEADAELKALGRAVGQGVFAVLRPDLVA